MSLSLLILALLGSYLLGSIPLGYLMARLRGIDLRRVGSGNVGATNTGRALGRPLGVVAFAFDFFKGFAPAFAAGRLSATDGRIEVTEIGPLDLDVIAVAMGCAAVLGHVLPVWLRFQGGKGVATSAGFLTALAPQALGAALLVWGVLPACTRYMSLASLAAAASFPAFFVLFEGTERAFGERREVTAIGCALAVAIIILHRANIGRLLRGQELKIGAVRSGEHSP